MLAMQEVSEVVTPTNSLPTFSSKAVLRDGSKIELKPLQPGDIASLQALLARCSPESLRFRFLHGVKELSERTLNYLADVDGAKRVALVAMHGETANQQIVAVGRYFANADRPNIAEVSFLVEDAMQRRGIGTLLLKALVEVALQHDITHFSADVLADNRLMLEVFRAAGFDLSASTSYGVTQLEFPITHRQPPVVPA